MDIDPLPAETPLMLLLNIGVAHIDFGIGKIIAIACAIFALILSGFISGSEISYFSLTSAQLDELDESKKGNTIRKLVSAPERLLATILIANNLVNVTIVVLLNFALGPIFEGMGAVLSFILQTVLLTFLILLFGEILPKLYANANPVGWAKFAANSLSGMVTMFKPISSMMVRSSSIVNHIVTKRAEAISTEELSQALEITDVKADDQKEMLEGILKFGDKTASEIMTPRVDLTDIEYNETFENVMKTVIDSGYSRLPVYEESQDNIKGILYSRDLLPYIGKEVKGFKWQSLLREPYFVPESRMIDDLLEDFRTMKKHLAIVVDEYGGTQGIVTMEDVLEEIVGDIDDEYDREEKTYKKLSNDTYIFDGRTLLTDFFKITNLNEDDYEEVSGDSDTLAGMLLTIKGDFPKEKEPLVYKHCRFLVLDIEDHRIAGVRVKVMPDIQES